ncbi:hypothetical protein niasHS_011796 [Heterodera schachtii]|uniref:Gland protein n=1 Tax=Heterodera schachtii TaxID=97005 RepID=A0ABD2IB92_HETSC
MLRLLLLIVILALFGDCMDKGKRKAGGININEPIVKKVKEKKLVETSRKGKEKVGEKINLDIMDTTKQIAQIDIAQDKAKMAPPKYLFIWSDNEKKNFEVDHAVIRLSKELSELFRAEDYQPDNAIQGEQEKLPVPKEEAEKMLMEVQEWYAHHKYDESKNAPIFVFKCKDNVTLVLNVHLGTAKLSKILSYILEDVADQGYTKPIPSHASNFKSDIMLKLMKMSEEYKDKADGLKKRIDDPMNLDVPREVAESSTSNVYAETIAEEIQKFVPPPHIMQWDVKTDLEMVRAAEFYDIKRLISDNYIDNVYEISRTRRDIRNGNEVEKENEWEESDEKREARHKKEREEEDERDRKEKQKQEERIRQEQLQQPNQQQNQEQQLHQLGQEHDEEQEHDEDMNDESEEEEEEEEEEEDDN